MDERLKLLHKRIKATADGAAYIEYLEALERQNFESFRHCDASMNDIHKGIAINIDKLLNAFRECDKAKEKKNFDNLI